MILEKLWNWKKYPASVWYLAGPLAILALGLHLMRAVLELTQNGDPWFLVIFAFAISLLAIALWPLRKHILRSNVKASGPEAGLSPEGRARLPGSATGANEGTQK